MQSHRAIFVEVSWYDQTLEPRGKPVQTERIEELFLSSLDFMLKCHIGCSASVSMIGLHASESVESDDVRVDARLRLDQT